MTNIQSKSLIPFCKFIDKSVIHVSIFYIHCVRQLLIHFLYIDDHDIHYNDIHYNDSEGFSMFIRYNVIQYELVHGDIYRHARRVHSSESVGKFHY